MTAIADSSTSAHAPATVHRSRAPRIPRPSADTWETVFSLAYLVVMTNVMLAVASAPLLVLLVTTDPRTSWPALAVAAVLATPALPGAFGVFRAHAVQRSTAVVRVFATTWWRHLRRSLVVGAGAVILVIAAVGDVAAVAGTRLGAVVTPPLLVACALVLATALLALVASVERPDARLRDVLRASLYLGVRRWYLTLGSFGVLGVLAGLFTLHPALAVGLAAAPLLYAVWGNARHTLRPVLPEGSSVTL